MDSGKQQLKLIVVLTLIVIVACASPPAYDVVILNGTVVDGSGQPGYRADIGVKKDQISHIGALKERDGRQVIDATGLVVCPGFIDHRQREVSLYVRLSMRIL